MADFNEIREAKSALQIAVAALEVLKTAVTVLDDVRLGYVELQVDAEAWRKWVSLTKEEG